MPVIVVGGDSKIGRAIVVASQRPGECGCSCPRPGATTLRGRGVKIAVGDLSATATTLALRAGAYALCSSPEPPMTAAPSLLGSPMMWWRDGCVPSEGPGGADHRRRHTSHPVSVATSEMRLPATDDMTTEAITHAVAALDEAQRL